MEHLPYTVSSESVSEGHPDKVCDYIADSMLDAYLAQDPNSHVACEVMCKNNFVILGGEISSSGQGQLRGTRARARSARSATWTRPSRSAPTRVHLLIGISKQSAEIDQGVTATKNKDGEQGAGDQGMMYGYATDETPELMPMPVLLAHRLTRGLAEDRKAGKHDWLRPDAKSQVSVVYENGAPVRVSHVLVSTQHTADDRPGRHPRLREVRPGAARCSASGSPRTCRSREPDRQLRPGRAVGRLRRHRPQDHRRHLRRRRPARRRRVQRQGPVEGRPHRRVLLPVRGAPDRQGQDLAKRAEIQVAYAIGMAQPISIKVDTFGTGDEKAAVEFVKHVRLPAAARSSSA